MKTIFIITGLVFVIFLLLSELYSNYKTKRFRKSMLFGALNPKGYIEKWEQEPDTHPLSSIQILEAYGRPDCIEIMEETDAKVSYQPQAKYVWFYKGSVKVSGPLFISFDSQYRVIKIDDMSYTSMEKPSFITDVHVKVTKQKVN